MFFSMLTRRHIRLKIVQYFYALKISDFEDTKEHHKNLLKGIESISTLFILQFSFLIEIFNKSKKTYNISKNSISKNISSKYTNVKFSKNSFLELLSENETICSLINSVNIVDWQIYYKYINLIYDDFINSEYYDDYINNNDDSFEYDKKIVVDLYQNIIVTNQKFQHFLEEFNIYWMDDFPLVNTILLKFIKNSKPDTLNKNFNYNLFSGISDKQFANDLANLSLLNFENNNKLVLKNVSNWELDRIAKLDLVIINIAITEINNFKDIPVKASLNEYIEIAKDYSTQKSSFFINGVLDKHVKDLVKNKNLIKEGRGLRE